jgi:predicted RNA-binding protein YlxR (DUF448 family)
MKHQPERTCIGCRTVRKKDEVVRIVSGPERVVIDYREKLAGRAAYVCPKKECIQKALTKEGLGRALRLTVRPPDVKSFLSQLGAGITERIKSLLAISMKAGKLAAGYSAVQDALEKGRVELLLYASDLSSGTKEKVSGRGIESIRSETLFTRDDLGDILNRELVGIVAILDKGLADALWHEMQRLKGLINTCD